MSEPISTPEQIERRAYELYLERGKEDGHERADWLAAEKELNETELARLLEKSASNLVRRRATSARQRANIAN